MSYDTSNVFAKILRGEIPSAKVYEDTDALVIMDTMPQSDGHCSSSQRRPRATCSTPTPRCFHA